MLNKELLMIGSQSYNQVYVTLRFFGGRNSGTYFDWTSPDGTSKTETVFDERIEVVRTLICKPNTKVYITTEDYSGDYTATPPQDITVVEAPTDYQLTFTAFRDVEVSF
mgnify:CR=1 FL=1|jgi:hypothetical protein